MPIIELHTEIRVPADVCFDLSRSVDLHMQSVSHTREAAIAGVMRGLMGEGDEVCWRARHFFIWQTLTSKITSYDRPNRFRDSMVQGPFARFDHDHIFADRGGLTLMTDVFDYDSPLGTLGKLADWLFLESYMRSLLLCRNGVVKQAAESGTWRQYIVQ